MIFCHLFASSFEPLKRTLSQFMNNFIYFFFGCFYLLRLTIHSSQKTPNKHWLCFTKRIRKGNKNKNCSEAFRQLWKVSSLTDKSDKLLIHSFKITTNNWWLMQRFLKKNKCKKLSKYPLPGSIKFTHFCWLYDDII